MCKSGLFFRKRTGFQMRLLDIARVLRQDADPARAASHFLEALSASPSPSLDDVAAITHRFARHARPPAMELFEAVSSHVDRSVRGGSTKLSGPSVAVLADAFAHVRCSSSVGTLSLACWGVAPTAVIPGQELLRFVRAVIALEAAHDPAIRSFVLLRFKAAAEHMEPCDLAESGRLLAQAQIYSEDLSNAIAEHLTVNPWAFKREDLFALLPHFHTWGLGPLQKKAFQRLALRLGEHTEFLSPADALAAIRVFADAGSVNEVLMQHMHLRLLIDRSFTELPPQGIAQLAASMAQVSYYHTGLLREIVSHIGEDHSVVFGWSTEHMYGALRSFGLAPVELPLATVRMLGCRYNSLLWEGSDAGPLRNFFEVAAHYPELLRTVLERGGGKRLALRLRATSAEWGPRACADAMLAIASTLDVQPGTPTTADGCACSADLQQSSSLSQKGFRHEQPEWQQRVVLRAVRHFRQRDEPGRSGFKQRVVHRELGPSKKSVKDLWMVEGGAALALPAPGTGRCAAEWALPGRRKALPPRPEGAASVEFLKAVLPQLFLGLRDAARDLAELPGSKLPLEMLEDAGDPEHMPKLLPHGGGAYSPVAQITAGGVAEGSGEVPPRAPRRPEVRSTAPDPEVMRRSELVQVCVQTLAALQLCIAPGGPMSRPLLSLEMCHVMAQLAPLLGHMLRPRREDDEVIQRFNLGPQRLEAFVRRPDEKMVLEVYKSLHAVMPFIPNDCGWALWEPRKDDILHSEPTGGCIVSINREVEVSPFVVCVVLRPKRPSREREWGASLDF
mmetsp:Transcript_169066/g.537181  ORF Transcript_169066/g.537181 Transcript_169066/m.537181 type:complete len:788 (+) Transcript_169066:13-2376(+)